MCVCARVLPSHSSSRELRNISFGDSQSAKLKGRNVQNVKKMTACSVFYIIFKTSSLDKESSNYFSTPCTGLTSKI